MYNKRTKYNCITATNYYYIQSNNNANNIILKVHFAIFI